MILLLGCAPAPPPPAEVDFAVVTLNLHALQEGPDSLDKLEAAGEGLAALDVDAVALQEVVSGAILAYDYGGAEIDALAVVGDALARASGARWHAVRRPFATWDQGEAMSLAILSRHPIAEHASIELTTTEFWPAPSHGRRAALHARLDVAGLGPVDLVTTHPWGWDSAEADAQLDEVKVFAAERLGGGPLALVLGDLNAPAGAPLFARWLDAPPLALVDAWALARPGERGRTQLDGPERIDHVLVADGAPAVVEVRVVFDGSDLPVVSDHAGVLARFSMDPAGARW